MELYLWDTIPNFKNNFFTKQNLAFYFKKFKVIKGNFLQQYHIKIKEEIVDILFKHTSTFWENLNMEETQKKIIINVII